MEKNKWMPEGKLCEIDFINSITIYLKTDVTSSLSSDNYLLRVFAYVDLFPQTSEAAEIQTDVSSHCESVVKLIRGDIDP